MKLKIFFTCFLSTSSFSMASGVLWKAKPTRGMHWWSISKNVLFLLFFCGCSDLKTNTQIVYKKSRILGVKWDRASRGNSLVPIPKFEECEEWREEALKSGCITQDEFLDLETINGGPICHGSIWISWTLCEPTKRSEK